MFYLIGADGREYGPFSAEQVRDWMAQGRANAHSRLRRDGETTWQALKDFAEFADASNLAGVRRRLAHRRRRCRPNRSLPTICRAPCRWTSPAASPAAGRSCATTPG